MTGWGRRISIAALAGIAVFTAASLPVMLNGQVGLTDPQLAPDPRTILGVTAALSLAYGILTALIADARTLVFVGTDLDLERTVAVSLGSNRRSTAGSAGFGVACAVRF